MNNRFILLLIIFSYSFSSDAQTYPDAIVGKWSSTEGNLVVQVYKAGNAYKGKLIWFDDSDDKNKPTNERMDEKNPNKAYRTRKLVGLEVLQNLFYNSKSNRWEHGKIYDSSSGKVWEASAWMEKDNLLKLRGFWHFEFLGQTITFKKST